MAAKVTKKEAREHAGRATRYGYFACMTQTGSLSMTEAWTDCLHCRERVTAHKMPWGRSWTLDAWTTAFYDHLQDCPKRPGHS
jgi:hypothetical protein